MTDGRDQFGTSYGWSWREGLNGPEVCKGRHRKHDPCYYEPATEQEVCLHAEIEAWKEVRNAEASQEEAEAKEAEEKTVFN